MDVKESRTEPILAEHSNDVSNKYGANGSAIQYNRNKPYQDIGSTSLAKVDVQTSRPCAVIGPDRIVPPPTSSDAYLKKAPLEAWPCLDTYHRPPEYPHKMADYQSQTRNISPRQTFQENMQRIMVPPTFSSVKANEETNFLVDRNVSHSKNIKSNLPSEAKYCDVPYTVNPNNSEPKNRNTEMCVSNVNQTLIRSAPYGWPPGSVNVLPQRPYGAPESYQYPEYTNCAAPRPGPMTRPHRIGHEEPGMVYSDPYFHDANIRFKPYPTPKDRYPQARYDYIGNYPGHFHPPSPFTPMKYDLQKQMPPHPYGYPQVPIKYIDSRVADPSMNGYQRPNQAGNINLPFRNHVIHPSYGPHPLGNPLQPKLHSYPGDASGKSLASSKLPYDNNNKVYVDYENVRPKNYPLNDSYYINDMTRSHHMKNQIMMPNTPSANMHSVHPHPYYRKENLVMKNYELVPHFNNMDGSIHNPLSRLPPQFSPNTIAISPSDSNASNDTSHTQGLSQEDCGYVSQSSTASVRSMDSGSNRLPNDFRRFDYRYRHLVRDSPLLSKPENSHTNESKDKKGLNVRQFLEMWKDGDDDNTENESTKEINRLGISKDSNKYERISNQEQLYVLGLVNVPSEELGKYEHIQKVSKLPENIKGYNNIELLNQFEEVFDTTKTKNITNNKPITQRDYPVPIKTSIQKQASLPLLPRPISPLDVEAKISQSIIHKEVGCNFEIKPCSPEMLNVEIATPIQNMLTERVIEKVTNPQIMHSPVLHGLDQNLDNCNIIKHQDHKSSLGEDPKVSSCKLISPQFITNNATESIKANYSLQDLESNSGICLASLPRLDNDIELNFPEVNQQFINANKSESVITIPTKNTSSLDAQYPTKSSPAIKDKTDDIKINNSTESESEFSKLSKYRKVKTNNSELREQDATHKNAQVVRTDSVIIKNPENIKNYDNSFINPIDSNIDNQSPQSGTTEHIPQNEVHPQNIEYKEANTKANEIAIDFSLNKNESESLTIASFEDPLLTDMSGDQSGGNSTKENGITSPSLLSSRDNIMPAELESNSITDATNNFLELDYGKYEDNHQLNNPNNISLGLIDNENNIIEMSTDPSSLSKPESLSILNTADSENKPIIHEDNDADITKLINIKDYDSTSHNLTDCELPLLTEDDSDTLLAAKNEVIEDNAVEFTKEATCHSELSTVASNEKYLKKDVDQYFTDNNMEVNDQDMNKIIDNTANSLPANLGPFEALQEIKLSNKLFSNSLESNFQQTEIKVDNHTVSQKCKVDPVSLQELHNSCEEIKHDEYYQSKRIIRNIRSARKELYSPWIQKLLIHSDGFTNNYQPKKVLLEDAEIPTELYSDTHPKVYKTKDDTQPDTELVSKISLVESQNIFTNIIEDDKALFNHLADVEISEVIPNDITDERSNNISAVDNTELFSSENDKPERNSIDDENITDSITLKKESIAEVNEGENLNAVQEIVNDVIEANPITLSNKTINSISDVSGPNNCDILPDELSDNITGTVTKSNVEEKSASNSVLSHDIEDDVLSNVLALANNTNLEVIANSESNITVTSMPNEFIMETHSNCSASLLEDTNKTEICQEESIVEQCEHVESIINKPIQNQSSKNTVIDFQFSRKERRSSLKRSLSESALHEYNNENTNDSKVGVDNKHFVWPIKRKKINNDSNIIEPEFIAENFCNLIQNRRNSISSIYNEENVSFCILIDDNCIITEESSEHENYAEILQECLPVEQEINEKLIIPIIDTESCNEEKQEIIGHLDTEMVATVEESPLEESWVDDIAYTETVVSYDIAEDIVISGPSSPKEDDLSDGGNDILNNIVNEHSDKVKEIYGGKMCSDDAQFVETLCRMPQMNVNKTLTYMESHVTEECSKYYDAESLERVLSESNQVTSDLPFSESNYSLPQTNLLESKDVLLKTPDDKENVNLDNALLLDFKTNVLNAIPNKMSNKTEEENVQPKHEYNKTQDDTIHSCESSIDNVFCYKDIDEITEYATSSSPEVSSTTSEDKKASILLKITSYKGSRISEVNEGGFRSNNNNKISCKYTEKKDYSSKPRPLLTKAAQKYIPPLKETIGDLKVKLALPPHSLVKLKQLKVTKNEPKIDLKSNIQSKYSKMDIVKKPKPKFEDVLKSIDEIQFKMHKEKKKVKKSVPKMVIKKTENGSHYASTSGNETYNPDLTGRKWQPWVFLEKNNFIDKMALKKKTKAVFNHRKNTYVLAEKFQKYKSIGSAKFVISPPKYDESCPRPLKYTIRLKHTY